ncbi:MAG TPA: 50S ribosomal protein L7/L12 [Candidatus Babeliales bacterium]|jgi:large subunit ribosomal protein L7/L12|nr:50S ribosomal protein L7/L12 [Candidatus Babeliales bacterium]
MAAKSYEKFVDEIGNMTVLELADLVKALESKFGISAAMPVASAAAPAAAADAAPAAAEKSEYKVTLADAGSEKIKVIKALREVIPNLALSDAKKLTEETPAVIAESVSKADAEKMKKKLEEVGAKVELA